MATKDGIACDFCDKPLASRPTLNGSGWDYIWSAQEIGSTEFRYATCKECCRDHTLLEIIDACLKRAERHGKAWRNAADRYIAQTLWRSPSMVKVFEFKAKVEAYEASQQESVQ